MEKKNAPDKRSRGRPSSFNERLANRVLDLCAKGKTDKQIAEEVGIALSTLSNWKSLFPDFSEAMGSAKNLADQLVVASLFARAIGYSHPAVKIVSTRDGIEVVPYTEHYPPDTTAAMFWLKNRQPKKWRDVNKHEHGGADDAKPIPLAYVPKSQRTKDPV